MKNGIALLTLPVPAGTGGLTAQRFAAIDGTLTGAGGHALGVARYTEPAGKSVPVDVLGTAFVESGAAISAGALVESDATGRAVPHNTGVVLGRVAPGDPGAGGAGEFPEIILIPN